MKDRHAIGKSQVGMGKRRKFFWLMSSLYKNRYRTFKLVETTIRKGLRKKKNRGNEQNWVIIHT
jgi:hypothetical protein